MWSEGRQREEMTQTTIKTIIKFCNENVDVEALRKFLTDEWGIAAQNVYLHCMQLQGDNKKGKAPRHKFTMESSWGVITEKCMGKLSVELWRYVSEKVALAWEADGAQMEPREKRERRMTSDALRVTLTACHVEFDRRFGHFLPQAYINASPRKSLDEAMDQASFTDFLEILDYRLTQDGRLFERAQQSSLNAAADEATFWGVVAASEQPPLVLKAAFRRNHDELKEVWSDENAYQQYIAAAATYYQRLLEACKKDNTPAHRQFSKEVYQLLSPNADMPPG